MKKIIYMVLAALPFIMSSCDQFDEAADARPIEGLKVKIDLNSEGLQSRASNNLLFGDNILVKLDNYAEGIHYEKVFSGSSCVMENIIPGLYTINVSGKAYNSDGDEYILAGNLANYVIKESDVVGEPVGVNVEMKGSQRGKLVFSEIYFCGSRADGGTYFRDQFYEIANNTDEVQYLDGLHFGHTDVIDFDKVRPIWPEGDEGNYVFLDRVWKIPGNGTDYPLQPGESCVIAQFAANHKLAIYNPNSPVDASTAEFEFNMNNANYPDQPAVDMVHVYYDGSATMTGMQYLTSVFGTGYVIFRIPEDEVWDPANDKSLQALNAADSWSDYFAKVPLSYVVDTVEGIRNATYVDAKNIPAVLDAGFVTLGAAYTGQSVVRKLDTERVATGGAVYYQDTNNSTDDFECGVVPMLHRYSKMPSWNHSLN